MRVIIVGNGLAGIISAKTLRELDKKVEIDVFAEEKYHYYPRPSLIEFLAGTIPFERMFAFPQEWYREQNINIHLGKPVTRIFPDSQEIEVAGGKKEKYESLLLANGSFSFIPPFKGTDKKGIFALRTLDDAFELLEYLKNHQRVVVIGGGLLGLEIARAMKSRGARVDVVEFFDRLLPRQLDIQGASLLKAQVENMGINVHLGLATEEILGQNDVRGLRFKGEREIEMDMAIVAAGVRPNIRLAKEAGLETDRGLVTDDYLQSSNPKIFGAGDVIQHRGRVYGIIPSSFNQARVVASNILGKKEKYEGTVPSNTLKVAGLDLTSVGLVNPEEGTSEEFRKEKKEEGIYKKVVIQKGVVVGAIWMGTKKGVNEINRIISQKINIEKHKISLLEDDFDYSVL
ncbi:MAG: NAD(P)/FAD-dependent oxidoreductase [Candidatus Aminicenantes bacterium]|nr:MAG: NAD(P)/FAD-dependent oxidoreductase [Candidatus Aminicenantes bacterium]